MTGTTRTITDFVREMSLRGRRAQEIIAVARATQWSADMDEVITIVNEHGRQWRAEGRDQRKYT